MKAAVAVRPDQRGHTVSRYLYSQFAENIGRCIYEGVWVGPDSAIPNDEGLRRDVLQALAPLELPALRWPGGGFADGYHWEDGVGPPNERPTRTSAFGERETNQFGTHEFMRLCAELGSEPYIALNVGTGTPQEAFDWVEYLTGNRDTTLTRMRAANGHPDPWTVPFFGVGNENWVGGFMRAEHYADLYRNFAWYIRGVAPRESKLIACGSHPGVAGDAWDRAFLDSLGREPHHFAEARIDMSALELVDYIALHNYTWMESALGYSGDDYLAALATIEGIRAHIEGAVALCEEKSTEQHQIGVIMDEWGIWTRDQGQDNSLQFRQSSMLDAVFAAGTLHMLHSLPGLFMANLSTMINVLQSLILTDGPRILRTPTYHVWEMFMPHRDATLLGCAADGVSASATISDAGTVTLSVVNTSLDEPAELAVTGVEVFREGRVLRSADVRDHNTFDEPDRISPQPFDGTVLPPHSVAVLTFT
jgi:alpha-L-arabinofuranosidase